MQIVEWWNDNPWLTVGVGVGTVLVGLAAISLVVRLVAKGIRAVRGANSNLKLAIGQALVQVGVTWAVVTGTYEFCTKVFKLPEWEAAAFATFLEAATWVTVGMIYDHGKSTDADGNPAKGFGPAGPFFWLFSVLGGVLAVLAGATFGAQVGRSVIVVFGTCLWYLALLRVTHRSGTPSRFRWTPRALLVAVGALAPAEQDVRDEHQEWQVRRMARAMRWANGRWPLSWLGTRMLTGRAEQSAEDVIAAARRRYAVAHVVVSSVRPDSEVMRRIIADVTRDPAEPVSAELRADLDEIRMSARQVTTCLRPQVDLIRAIDSRQDAGAMDRAVDRRLVHGVLMPTHLADQIPDQIPPEWVARFKSAAAPATASPATVAVAASQTVATVVDHTPAAIPAQRPATAGTEADRTAAAYAALVAELGRPPSGSVLAAKAGVSKSYANNWKKQNALSTTEEK